MNINNYLTIITIELVEKRKENFYIVSFDDVEIYLDNKKITEKSNSLCVNNHIKSIKIILKNERTEIKFRKVKYMKSVCVKNLRMVNTGRMFDSCEHLEKADFINFNFTNVCDMQYMFSNCKSLKKVIFNEKYGKNVNININFEANTSVNIFNRSDINADHMFDGCVQLKEIELHNIYNTYNVISMNYMFNDCNSLETVNLKNFNVYTIRMIGMFRNCYSLKELNISTINTASTRSMCYMFYKCYQLKKIIHNFNTNKVVNMEYMFFGCKTLEEIDLSAFNVPKITNMDYMFSECKIEEKYINIALQERLIKTGVKVDKLKKTKAYSEIV